RIDFFFSSRRRHTRFSRDWSSDVCSSDLMVASPRNTDNPITSVTVVSAIPPASAGSIFIFFNKIGIETPAMPATIRLVIIAAEKIGRAACRERRDMTDVGGSLEQQREAGQ